MPSILQSLPALSSSLLTGQTVPGRRVPQQRCLDGGYDQTPIRVLQVIVLVEFADPRLIRRKHNVRLLGGITNAD
jgi:hypothetical protein